jgi:hypothetical protein
VGARDGIYQTCTAYHINPTTYCDWRHKLGFTKLPRSGRPERFSEEENLAPAKQEKTGVSGRWLAVSSRAACTDRPPTSESDQLTEFGPLS